MASRHQAAGHTSRPCAIRSGNGHGAYVIISLAFRICYPVLMEGMPLARVLAVSISLALLTSAVGCSPDADKQSPVAAISTKDPSPPSKVVHADDRPVIVALGDSLTAGLGVDPGQNYPARLQAKLDLAGYRYRVVNAGVSGDTSAQGLNRLPAIRSLHPALVIVELGANDGLRGIPATQTRDNLDEIIRTLRDDGVKVVLAGMEMPPNYGPDYTRQFRSVFRDLAKEYELPLIPFFLEGVGGIAELNQEDGIHPTAQGYVRVTENVWKILEPLVRPGA